MHVGFQDLLSPLTEEFPLGAGDPYLHKEGSRDPGRDPVRGPLESPDLAGAYLATGSLDPSFPIIEVDHDHTV